MGFSGVNGSKRGWMAGLGAVCVLVAGAAGAFADGLPGAGLGVGPGDKKGEPAAGAKAPDPVLLSVMESELDRAMKSLGSGTAGSGAAGTSAGGTSATDAGGDAGSAAPGKNAPAPKPYFISYSVSDAENVSMAAQFGALTADTANRQRMADIQVRLGSVAEDNTHGTHRNSALTTIPLPLSDDKAALARSLWFATNRGYGRALDSLLQVKTEQQVRAKEEDSSADFSAEKPVDALVAADPKFTPSTPLLTDKAEWAARLRELSGVFKQFPDVFYNEVALQASNEEDYFCRERWLEGEYAEPCGAAGDCGADAGGGRDGPVPDRDVRERRAGASAGREDADGEDAGDGEEP